MPSYSYDERDYQILKQIAEGGIEYTHHYGYQPKGAPLPTEGSKINGRTLKRFERLGLIEFKLTNRGMRAMAQLGVYYQALDQGASEWEATRVQDADFHKYSRSIIDKRNLAKVIVARIRRSNEAYKYPAGWCDQFMEWVERESTLMADVMLWATAEDVQETQDRFNELNGPGL